MRNACLALLICSACTADDAAPAPPALPPAGLLDWTGGNVGAAQVGDHIYWTNTSGVFHYEFGAIDAERIDSGAGELGNVAASDRAVAWVENSGRTLVLWPFDQAAQSGGRFDLPGFDAGFKITQVLSVVGPIAWFLVVGPGQVGISVFIPPGEPGSVRTIDAARVCSSAAHGNDLALVVGDTADGPCHTVITVQNGYWDRVDTAEAVLAATPDGAYAVLGKEGVTLMRRGVALASLPGAGEGRLVSLFWHRWGWLTRGTWTTVDVESDTVVTSALRPDLAPAPGWVESSPTMLLLVDADRNLYIQPLE